MTTQSTQRFRIIEGILQSLGGTNLANGFIVPNRDDTAQLPTGGPQFTYQESGIATSDFEGATTAPTDFNLDWSWPFELMYPTPSQGEENRIRRLLKSGAPTAATTEVTGVTSTGGISMGGVFGIQLSGGSGNVETGIEVGDVVRVRDNSNNLLSFGEVYFIDSGTHVLGIVSNSDIPDGANRKILRGRRLKPGTTKEYAPLEFAGLDPSPGIYERFTDSIPSSWNWGFRNGQLGIKGTWSGQATGYAQASAAYSSTPVSETASPIFAPKITSTIVKYGGTALSILSMDANVVHPLSGTKLATQLAATDLVPGRISSSGNFSCFLDDTTKLAIVQAGTAAALLCAFTDSSKQSLVVRWPSVKLTTDVKQREGTFISQQIGWQSQRDTAVDSVGIRVLTFPS